MRSRRRATAVNGWQPCEAQKQLGITNPRWSDPSCSSPVRDPHDIDPEVAVAGAIREQRWFKHIGEALSRMSPPCVKRLTVPESGCGDCFPPAWASRRRPGSACAWSSVFY
jgi:hypothetical protein